MSTMPETSGAGAQLPGLEQFLKDAGPLPSLPTIYAEISAAVDDPKASSRKIGEIVAKDQGLTTRLLRLANSAFYAFPGRIDTVTEAVTLIGLEQVRSLALATKVIDLFKDVPSELLSVGSFWGHSLACGLCARLLALERRDPNSERLFVAGLLHDVGRLVVLTRAPGPAAEVLRRSKETGEPVLRAETHRLGFTHADLAGRLLQQWKIPADLAEIVRSHHQPQHARLAQLETAAVHLADVIVSGLGYGESGEYVVPGFSPEPVVRLQLRRDFLSSCVSALDEQFRPVAAILLEGVKE